MEEASISFPAMSATCWLLLKKQTVLLVTGFYRKGKRQTKWGGRFVIAVVQVVQLSTLDTSPKCKRIEPNRRVSTIT